MYRAERGLPYPWRLNRNRRVRANCQMCILPKATRQYTTVAKTPSNSRINYQNAGLDSFCKHEFPGYRNYLEERSVTTSVAHNLVATCHLTVIYFMSVPVIYLRLARLLFLEILTAGRIAIEGNGLGQGSLLAKTLRGRQPIKLTFSPKLFRIGTLNHTCAAIFPKSNTGVSETPGPIIIFWARLYHFSLSSAGTWSG
ncbi:hypothetical protein CC78DRAFT_576687 [Lojkania enalia]|uniref:Uncharacterized protein n=1 Tax=Lojkania enalia TaxID=147567 RepID=A0A9P4KFD3_9PLEO|nr:hypothetical protein CC78DRAFT_576687 [Didymosphaeria enalia]